jgi:hypothetical protein
MRPVEQGAGGSVVVAFAQPPQAVVCELELQRGLQPAADIAAGPLRGSAPDICQP